MGTCVDSLNEACIGAESRSGALEFFWSRRDGVAASSPTLAIS